MIRISAARHAYPEGVGFCIDRLWGYREEYTFLHFHNSVEINQNGSIVLTRPHAVILYEPDVPQYFKSVGPLTHDWMHFSCDEAQRELPEDLPLNTVFYPGNPSAVTAIVAELESEWLGGRTDGKRLSALKAEELFIKLARSRTGSQTEPQNPRLVERLRDLRSRMFLSLDEPWTVKDMAEAVFLSESRFYTLYHGCFGISPMADLINARMNAAKNRLVMTGDSVESIAVGLGYRNTTHFIRQFRKDCGMTPARYRREQRERDGRRR